MHLAEHEGEGASLIADIAAHNAIPKKFLDAILLELKHAGFLHSKKGRGGGYSLARPASRILIGDVIRVLDGPLAPIPCASRTAYRRCDDCQDTSACPVRSLMLDVRDAMARILDRTSLADLRSRAAGGAMALVYDI
ncbi:MAG: Rrf2 family transcriptional regulator [Rhodospirillales bacterium]|nr:Rrf2 family transcriptional regulator [Rhodospirillales bacterium]